MPRLLPSVLDYRFTGDPWIHDWKDGHFTVNLGNFRVSHIQGVSFDWPAFNGLLDRVRQRCHRRRR